jgi:hypothetical protein
MRLKSFNLSKAASMRQRRLVETLVEAERLLPVGAILE